MILKRRIYILATLSMLAVLTGFSAQAQESVRGALRLCADTIIPSLFPFFVLSVLLNRLGLPGILSRLTGGVASALFGVSGEGASALFIGLIGGYPMGASYIADMYLCGRIGREEGERLLTFCNNSGPAFIIGAIGMSAFHSTAAGLMLYGVHIFSALLNGLIFSGSRSVAGRPPVTDGESELETALTDAVKSSVTAVLNVCGFVVIFSVLVGLLDCSGYFSRLCMSLGRSSGLGSEYIRALLTGVLELGNGAYALSFLPLSPASLALAAFLVGFGSVSVHCQTAAVLSLTGMKGTLHFAGRLSMAIISALTAFVCGIFFLK